MMHRNFTDMLSKAVLDMPVKQTGDAHQTFPFTNTSTGLFHLTGPKVVALWIGRDDHCSPDTISQALKTSPKL